MHCSQSNLNKTHWPEIFQQEIQTKSNELTKTSLSYIHFVPHEFQDSQFFLLRIIIQNLLFD
jgi:hypothetical protein